MANKFLPFITEKSTPLHLYQALLSRGKGINEVTLLTLFYIVVKEGIEPIRSFIKNLPSMDTVKLYEHIVQNYPHRFNEQDLNVFQKLEHFLTPDEIEEISDSLNEFELKDVLSFLYLMTFCNQEENYTSLPFTALLKNKDQILNNIPDYVKFDNDGVARAFKDAETLRVFILYTAAIKKASSPYPIRAVFKSS